MPRQERQVAYAPPAVGRGLVASDSSRSGVDR
jgi:hypothetical protein